MRSSQVLSFGKNHGAYVSCVAQAATEFFAKGLISNDEMGSVISSAGQSDCGMKK